jgi:hypothetical protein
VDIGTTIHLRNPNKFPKGERILYSANVGFGINWLFSENIAIFGQPNLRYYLTPQKLGELKENRITLGLELGFRTYFR